MSAFVVTAAHIDALITYARDNSLLGTMTEDQAGQMLHDENVRSVNHRYSHNEAALPDAYHFKPFHAAAGNHPLAALILKACDCYDYQACETDDYFDTMAAKLVARIRNRAISRVPGWDAAPWGLTEDHRPKVVALTDLLPRRRR